MVANISEHFLPNPHFNNKGQTKTPGASCTTRLAKAPSFHVNRPQSKLSLASPSCFHKQRFTVSTLARHTDSYAHTLTSLPSSQGFLRKRNCSQSNHYYDLLKIILFQNFIEILLDINCDCNYFYPLKLFPKLCQELPSLRWCCTTFYRKALTCNTVIERNVRKPERTNRLGVKILSTVIYI